MLAKKSFFMLAAFAALFVACEDSGSSAPNGSVTVKVKDGYFTDSRDGNKYRVQTMGSDVWFAENLRYADSSAMPNLKGNMWCPDGEASKCKKFGPLYSWTAAMDVDSDYLKKKYGEATSLWQGVCPDGWRVPTNYDWVYLYKVVNKRDLGVGIGESIKSAEGWVDVDGEPEVHSDRFAFSGMPAGRRNKEGGFLESGAFAFFWTASEIDMATASGWTLRNDNAVLDSGNYYKEHGMSVRCIALNPGEIEWSGDEGRKTFPLMYDSVKVGDRYYRTLTVAGNVWMADNLDVETENSRCYADKEENCKKYGRLYTFEEAKQACPEGWHLANSYDWNKLLSAAENDITAISAKDVWEDDIGTDALGFSSVPGGTFDNGSFSDLGNGAYYWVAMDGSNDGRCLRYYYYSSETLEYTPVKEKSGAAVRCVKDVVAIAKAR